MGETKRVAASPSAGFASQEKRQPKTSWTERTLGGEGTTGVTGQCGVATLAARTLALDKGSYSAKRKLLAESGLVFVQLGIASLAEQLFCISVKEISGDNWCLAFFYKRSFFTNRRK